MIPIISDLMNFKWEFSCSEPGEILESRQMSETHISGGGSDANGNIRPIRSSTTHFNRCRVRWSNGKEAFSDLSGDYSVGDKVVLVYADGKLVTDLNVNTGEYIPKATAPKSMLKLYLYIAVSFILCFLLVGFLLIGALLFWFYKRHEALKAQLADYINNLPDAEDKKDAK